MALFTLGQAADLTDVSIQKIWLKQTDLEQNTVYEKYFNVENGVVDYLLKDSSLSGLGVASRIVENSVITSEAPVQGFKKVYTQVEYGKLLPVTKQMWKFGIKKRNLEGVSAALRTACVRLREELCADRVDNMFSTSYTRNDDGGNYSVTISGGDSAALITSSHSREDGGTAWSNLISDGTTVNMDLDYDALKAMHKTAAQIRDPKGKLMNITIDTILVRKNFENSFRLKEMLGAIRNGGPRTMPSSADNDAAGVPAYQTVEVPYIATNTAYWLGFDSSLNGKSPEFGLQVKESQPISLEGPNIVFKTGEIQYKATTLFDLGHNDSRPIVGSKNTDAA